MSTGMKHTHILVAPRELADLVYRCARTAGVQAGTATALADQWTSAAMTVAGTDTWQAARNGLAIERGVFDCLCRSAEMFLVSEQLLDQIAEASAMQISTS